MSAEQIQQAKQRFADVFGGTATAVVSAPGRVNLIGEHTDYNEGFVMPFCIDRYTVIAARPTGTAVCRVSSADGGVRNAITSFPGDSSLEPAPAGDWTNYMRGVVAGYLPKLPPGGCGFDAVVLSTVPLGGGLSSSAALEVATATLIETLYCLRVDPSEKALICQRCEHNFCGTPCGIMDQFISACGREGHALLIDCRPPFATEHVPLNNPKFTLVVANSNVKHSLSGSEYPERVQQCKDACAAMQAAGHTEVRFLRDATVAALESVSRSHGLSADVVRRARHAISEDQRTLQAKEALQAGDYEQVGKLMYASHASLRDDYNVSTPELDALVEIARGVTGVYGSRMTGGGFGGCTVTLVRTEAVPALLDAIDEQYPRATGGQRATCFVTRPSAGAMLLQQGTGALPAASAPLRSRLGMAVAAAAVAMAAVAVASAVVRARR